MDINPETPRERTSLLRFEYDPWRGGFLITFGGFDRAAGIPVCAGLIKIMKDSEGRVVALESAWGHGGIPLRNIADQQLAVTTSSVVRGTELRTRIFQLRQNPATLAIWFSTGNSLPRFHWIKQKEPDLGVTFYFSTRKAKVKWRAPGQMEECPILAGIELELTRTAVVYPINEVRIEAMDFK